MSPTDTSPKPQIPDDVKPLIIQRLKELPIESILHRIVTPVSCEMRNPASDVPRLLEILKPPPYTTWRERWLAATLLSDERIPNENRREVAVTLGKVMNGTDVPWATREMEHGLVAAGCAIAWGVIFFGLSVFILAMSVEGWLSILFNLFLIVSFLAFLIGTPAVFFGMIASNSAKENEVRLAAAQALLCLQWPESVSALAKAARRVDEVADQARGALASLLPILTEADINALGTEAVPDLCALLDYWKTLTPLEGRILDALAVIGDGRAVEPVQKRAQLGSTPELRAKAEAILPILLARRERENAHSTLLRGSSAPETKPTELLRAASYASTTEPEQLLRPTLGPQNNTNTPNG